MGSVLLRVRSPFLCYTVFMLATHLKPRETPSLTLKSRFDNWEILAHKLRGGWVASAIEINPESNMTLGIGISEPVGSWHEAVSALMESITPMCEAHIIGALVAYDRDKADVGTAKYVPDKSIFDQAERTEHIVEVTDMFGKDSLAHWLEAAVNERRAMLNVLPEGLALARVRGQIEAYLVVLTDYLGRPSV